MKKILGKLLNRIVIFGILLAVQLGWFLLTFTKLVQYSTGLSLVFRIISILAVLWIINTEDNPAYKIAWIILILVAPLLGGLFYMAVGHKRPTKGMRKRLDAERKRTEGELKQQEEVMGRLGEMDQGTKGESYYLAETGGYPVWDHSSATYYKIGEEYYASLLDELKKAEHFIFMEFFIVGEGKMWNSILKVLEEKAAAGVDVRFIYDDLGCVSLLPPAYSLILESKGIKSFAFNPFIPLWSLVMNNRDHRKIVVIDGHTAFSGGVNLADEYINEKVRFGHWKDTGFMLKGEAVWNYTVMFLRMWNAHRHTDESYEAFRPHVWHPEAFEGQGFIQPYSDSPLDDERLGENVYLNILNRAKDYVYIFTPYLIVDHEMQTALCLAAKRGVDVRIMTPGIPDKKTIFQLTRSYYPVLLKAGVRIYEYTPGFLHAKSFVCDDEAAVVGTINMDYRSLYLHFECGTFFYQNPLVMDVKRDSLTTMEKGREIALSDTRQGFFGSLFCAVLRVFSPLL